MTSRRKTIEAVLAFLVLLAVLLLLGMWIEEWRAEVWAERFHQMRPTTGEPR
jgi:hypothetical protein